MTAILPRLLKIILGSAISFVSGFLVGFAVSTAYVDRFHPNDPDPVDFAIGAYMLLPWAGIWFIGTGITLWLVLRKPLPR